MTVDEQLQKADDLMFRAEEWLRDLRNVVAEADMVANRMQAAADSMGNASRRLESAAAGLMASRH